MLLSMRNPKPSRTIWEFRTESPGSGHGTTTTCTFARSVSPFTMPSTSTVPDSVTRFEHCTEPDTHAYHAFPGLANRRGVVGTTNPLIVVLRSPATLTLARAFAVRVPIETDEDSNRLAAPPSGVKDHPRTVNDPFA